MTYTSSIRHAWIPVLALFAIALLSAGCGSDQGSDASSDAADTTYSDDMAEQHEGDTPEATAAAREPMMPVETSAVGYATNDAGETVTGYMAVPENPDSVLTARGMDPETSGLPGLVVIHEWWGLNDNIETAARRLAGEGYRVLAVDLYDGSTADSPDGARALMQQAMQNTDRLAANLTAANNYLKTQANAPRTAVMGWCFGGAMTLTAAMAQPDGYAGAVVYYGRVEGITQEDVAPISFPMLGFFGADDGSIPVSSVRSFESTMEEAGKDLDVYIYDDAGHAFANPSGTRYNAEAAEDAWEKTTAFLQERLYGTGEIEATSAQ